MPAPARRLFAQLPVLAMAVVIAGCTFVKRKDPRLEGERLPVLVYDTGIKADPELASVPVTVAPPRSVRAKSGTAPSRGGGGWRRDSTAVQTASAATVGRA